MMKLVSRSHERGALVELWSDGVDVMKITKKVKFARRKNWLDRLLEKAAAFPKWWRLLFEKPGRCL